MKADHLPKGWITLPLGDKEHFDLATGGTPSTAVPEYWNGDIPWLSSGEVHKKRVFEVDGRITALGYKCSNAVLHPVHSILIALAGQGKTRGTAAITEVPLTTNQSVAAIIPNLKVIDPYYVYHYLDSQYEELRSASAGAGRAGLSLSILSKFPVDLPQTIFKQRKISLVLNTIDELIEKIEGLIAKYQAVKQGMMHDLFTRGVYEHGHLRPPYEKAPHLYHETPLGWVPKDWEVIEMENSAIEVIDGDRGNNYPSLNELHESGYCLFLSANNVTKEGFLFNENVFITEEKDNKLRSGKLERFDIVVTTRGTVGNIAYYDDAVLFKNIRLNSGMLILRNKHPKLRSEFLYYSFKYCIFPEEFKKVVSGSAQPQLPKKDIRKFHIVTPCEVEQNAISQRIKSISTKIQAEIRYLTKLGVLKKGLMQDLLTGKVPVKLSQEEETLETVEALVGV
jgi:type I restriction enzyme S subunit